MCTNSLNVKQQPRHSVVNEAWNTLPNIWYPKYSDTKYFTVTSNMINHVNFKVTPNHCLKYCFFFSLHIDIFWSKWQKTLLQNATIFSNACYLYAIFSISTFFFSSNKANCLLNEWEPDSVFSYSKLHIILVYLWYTTDHVKECFFSSF